MQPRTTTCSLRTGYHKNWRMSSFKLHYGMEKNLPIGNIEFLTEGAYMINKSNNGFLCI